MIPSRSLDGFLTQDAGRDNGRRRRSWWRPALLAGGVVLAGLALRGNLPDWASTWAALRHADGRWLAAAAVLQVLSMATFGEQQRRLLGAFGVSMSAATSLAVSYARSAIAIALPAGSIVSAGYAFRQFRSRGASQHVAAAVMVLSGLASLIGLALLYTGDALLWAVAPDARLTYLTAGVAVAGLVLLAARPLPGRATALSSAPRPYDGGGSPVRRLHDTARRSMALARAVGVECWLAVAALAVLNWLTDLACLLAALRALALAIPALTVATTYLALQLVRQIPLTPGGIGVIEASLLLALTAAGAAAVPAAAAVLVYRLLSCWAILPVGLLCWTTQRAAPVARL
ncbi:lysylphosphatidylglycerol synthase transmembrane domain-containing protein [Planosporangium mesophilum]|uniref:TIGR00374 family protein n=1 Tax=Planosporangium mesophilum TaxID=689768 RepID=A0A8J3X1U8_9ACTN|nr:YbhN family protein [Planosporangium mesophilum]GII24802.1 hypothetical protein Pme01_43990 [Planosporangium mesophilum]